jgi:hypothetical protein
VSQTKLFHDSLETQNPWDIEVNYPNERLASAVELGFIGLNVISASDTANVFSSGLGGAA